MTDYQRLCYLMATDAARHGGLRLWLAFRLLPGVLLAALLLVLLWLPPAGAEASAMSSGPDLNELSSGHMLMHAAAGDPYVPAIIQASKVHFDISGMIATVEVEQTFRNGSDQWQEGVYAFPLPDTAAVRRLEILVGERHIVGKIREKAIAREIYQAAKSAGKIASLLEQQRPNLFTNRVANIGPGEVITVRLEYVQQVAYVAGEFALRFPTTLTPRYMPGVPLEVDREYGQPAEMTVDPYLGWALATDQVPDADAISPPQNPQLGSERTPLNPIQITARLDMGMPLARVEAPYHEIALSRRAGVYDLRLATGVSEMDRDFVLNWQPVTGSAPTAALFTEQVGDEFFGLLLVLPPALEPTGAGTSREIILVIDTSGSMGGVSIEQARESLARALLQLRPEDRFNIIEFNSSYRALYRAPVPASRHHVQQAREFVRLLRASGGTEMLPALRAALDSAPDADVHQEQLPLRQVIFITDGAVANEVALFEEITEHLGRSRLFTVGIGSAPNSWFMRKAAQFGRGTHTHIGDLDEVGSRMAALFDQLARPAALNLSVEWPNTVEAWPERIPDLYHGQPLLVAASFGVSPPQGEVVVHGASAGQPWRKQLQVSSGDESRITPRHKGVASLWARQKISGLLDQKVQGRAEEEVRADVLPVALQHQLLSPYTSFVAVDKTVSRQPTENLDSTAVANTVPLGQSPLHFAYPRTATTGPAKAWLGGLLLFLGVLLRVLRQPEVDHVPAPGIDRWSKLLALCLLLAGLHQLAAAGLIQAKAKLAPVLIERAWGQSLKLDGAPVKPWPWADTWPVARLAVPALEVDLPVLAGDSGNVLAFGPGHALASAVPGSPGMTVIGGHRDTHFAFLENLPAGALIQLELPTGELRNYLAETLAVVNAEHNALRSISAVGESLLLVTCYPFGSLRVGGPLRYVVHLVPHKPGVAAALSPG